ncbi:4-alpha-glucanotransferase [Trueperella pecoris]|uniref:4-alpha-glucanotransferase n=1 Tax=Trueperella pecoris TaxID=2733571 RepID=A0A7M1QWI3_9ACTO|nr:4-alpha-glucanotransferase [Trueperella pecoris]QOQ39143.1 4-alpha-glucanotransferase [Trueperella pecoris]QOR46226.1 4-alpha-glucanotransferase [Trueperella pecoris]QTG76051.1 4-alpha-glucanotransferase [Trueperella pecoris]
MTHEVNRDLLEALADSYGVALDFWDFDGTFCEVSTSTLISVLRAMGVDASTDETIQAELRARVDRPWRRVLPPCTVARNDRETPFQVHVPHGCAVRVDIVTEDGSTMGARQIDDYSQPREIDGVLIGQASFVIPTGTPLGYHILRARVDYGNEIREEEATLIVTPTRLDVEARLRGRAWGMMAQLYSTRSRESWGIGDTADLAEMGSLFGDLGADFLLVNPLHAAEPIEPMSPSPYLPVTRRFFNPMYIRPEDIREVAYMSGPQRSLVTWASENVKKFSLENNLIDRDAAWKAKREALDVIFAAGRSQARQRDFERFRAMEGQGLEDFALWCALVEKYGNEFPPQLRDINSPYVARERRELANRVDFWAWLQWVMDEQLSKAQEESHMAGMRIGISHDLAVGVHPTGADVWMLPNAFAKGIGVGAPPDMYNQQGQNWSQPPWRPDTLEEMDYAPLRDMARTVMRHAGLLRVDHIMGLFRLWWIPEGSAPTEGTYVRFNHEAMVGVLLLEAHRAGVIVVGEDLGTVEPWVREYLRERGIFGTSVFWFEKDESGWPIHPEEFRSDAMVSVDTHDLPPAAGYLAGEHVDLRESLGLLVKPVEEVRAEADEERERVMHRLREHGLIGDSPSEREIVEALHNYVAQTPAPIIQISLVNAVGERRAQNQPGTDQEYPNWRVPMADGTEKVVLVEDLAKNPRLQSLVAAFTHELRDARI